MTQRVPIEIVEYDPRWPLNFARLRDALTAALGALAVAVEHVGSTSVPDLAAKPVIDLDIVRTEETKTAREHFLLPRGLVPECRYLPITSKNLRDFLTYQRL